MLEISNSNLPLHNTNIFNLLAPETFWCAIKSYRLGLTELRLEIYQDKYLNKHEMIFSRPIYFEGSTSWKSADFYLASTQDCLEILLNKTSFLDGANDIDVQYFLEHTLLFEVKGNNKENSIIKILASNASLSSSTSYTKFG